MQLGVIQLKAGSFWSYPYILGRQINEPKDSAFSGCLVVNHFSGFFFLSRVSNIHDCNSQSGMCISVTGSLQCGWPRLQQFGKGDRMRSQKDK